MQLRQRIDVMTLKTIIILQITIAAPNEPRPRLLLALSS